MLFDVLMPLGRIGGLAWSAEKGLSLSSPCRNIKRFCVTSLGTIFMLDVQDRLSNLQQCIYVLTHS